MDTTDFLRHIQSLLWYEGQIAHLERLPARKARTAELDPPLDRRIESRLSELGIGDLYTHQAQAIDALRDGKNVIVATPRRAARVCATTCRFWKRC